MANSVALNLDYDNSPEINGALNPDVANLKKRKFVGGAVEENLPAPKHTCCNVVINSEQDTLLSKALHEDDVHPHISEGQNVMDVLDVEIESGEDSNSFPGGSHLSAEGKFDAGYGKTDDEVSTSWSNSGPGISLLGSKTVVSATDVKEGIIFTEGEHYTCQDTGWHNIDFLQECLSAEHSMDSKKLAAEGLQEFLSSSGMNSNLSLLSAERWNVDQGAQLERHKPTIDQEFEQYFSVLML